MAEQGVPLCPFRL